MIKKFVNELGSLRVVDTTNRIGFVGRDLVELLGYVDYNKVITTRTTEDNRYKKYIENVKGKRHLSWVVTEEGADQILKSFGEVLKAKKIREWITNILFEVKGVEEGMSGFVSESKKRISEAEESTGLIGQVEIKPNFGDMLDAAKKVAVTPDYIQRAYEENLALNEEIEEERKKNIDLLLNYEGLEEEHEILKMHAKSFVAEVEFLLSSLVNINLESKEGTEVFKEAQHKIEKILGIMEFTRML